MDADRGQCGSRTWEDLEEYVCELEVGHAGPHQSTVPPDGLVIWADVLDRPSRVENYFG